MNKIIYKGYAIDIIPSKDGFKYEIVTDIKVVAKSMQTFPLAIDAEVAAKLYINTTLIGSVDGWVIS